MLLYQHLATVYKKYLKSLTLDTSFYIIFRILKIGDVMATGKINSNTVDAQAAIADVGGRIVSETPQTKKTENQ